MDPRLSAAPVVATFAAAVGPVVDVVGFYAAGSLATGDFRPGVSDLDLVAVVEAPLDRGRRARLVALHERTMRDPAAAKLHCVYVPRAEAADLAREHPTWAHGELYPRALGGIARAELQRWGITVSGPPPTTLIPALGDAAVAAAARAELAGYWTRAARRRRIWLQDVYVDLGLLVLARAEATIEDGRLITKSEAITRLPRFGVPPALVEEIARRRAGETVPLTRRQRRERARTVRRLVRDGLRALR